MGIKKNLSNRKKKELSELNEEMKNDNESRMNQNSVPKIKLTPIQKLFLAGKHVFANAATGVVPSSEHIEMMRSVLAGLKSEDIGLTPDMPYFSNIDGGTPKITYLHIYECEQFSMGIFCLPPSAVIPLHNHPGMTVFSKLVFGTMHIKSYDWAPANLQPSQTPTQIPEKKLAKIKVDADFTAPCNPSILYPDDGGNMHCFTALTACAVLDVLGPPYSDPDGRHCEYYRPFPFSNFPVDVVSIPEEEKKDYEWLEEMEKPESLEVMVQMYRSSKTVEN